MCLVVEVIAEILIAIGAVVAAIYACVHVATRCDYLQYFVGPEFEDIRQADKMQVIALYIGIAGYFANIAAFIVIALVMYFRKKDINKCICVALFLLMLTAATIALFSNITAIVLVVIATNTFKSATPELMRSSLQNNFTHDAIVKDNGTKLEFPEQSAGVMWHAMQYELTCCGYDGYYDYYSLNSSAVSWKRRSRNVLAPITCCQQHDDSSPTYPPDASDFLSSCMYNATQSWFYYKAGCYDRLLDEVVKTQTVVIVLACFVILQVLLTNCVRALHEILRGDDDDD